MNDVVVQGAGPIGLYSTVVGSREWRAHHHRGGAPTNRLELAKRWGADHVINIDEYKPPTNARK